MSSTNIFVSFSLLIVFLFGINWKIEAQVIAVNDQFTAQKLVEDFLINSTCANVSNFHVSGFTFANGNKSYGAFQSNGSNFPFLEGVIITTGRAVSAVGPNTSLLGEGSTSWGGDSDLEAAIGETNTINATVLEFDFIPLTNKISFEYLFASEQYFAYSNQIQCNYSDGFAFLLREAGAGSFINLALVPGTNIPVKVTTVRGSGTICPPANQAFFDAFNGTNHPTNFNGQTKILKAEAQVTPGVPYQMKLVIADQGNQLYDSAIFFGAGSFKVEIDLGDDRLIATNNPLCSNESLVLDASSFGGTNFSWTRNGILIPGATQANYTATQAGVYEVKTTIGGCEITGSIQIETENPPVVNPITLTNCGSNGSSIFNLNQAINNWNQGQNYYITLHTNLTDAQNQQNAVANVANYPSGNTTLYANISTNSGCATIRTLQLTVTQSGVTLPLFSVCDNDAIKDGFTTINLSNVVTPTILNAFTPNHVVAYYSSLEHALLNQQVLPNLFTNTSTPTQTIFARVTLLANCEGIVPVTIQVTALTGSAFQPESRTICPTQAEIIQAPIIANATYVWNNGATTPTLLVNQAGTYEVTVTTANGCSNTKSFTITALPAPQLIDAQVTSFQGNQNSIEVIYTGSGTYEFSINGTNFQSSPIFNNVPMGVYQVTLRDTESCYVLQYSVTVLDYMRYFTPNGDGTRDIWNIAFLRPRDEMRIYDRYGKLLHQFLGNATGWNGTFRGNPLPASDYWFHLILENGTEIKGHFSLLR